MCTTYDNVPLEIKWTFKMQYTLYGDAINHAARLMVKAKAGYASAKILCDINTFHFGKSEEAMFLPLGAIQVRSFSSVCLLSDSIPLHNLSESVLHTSFFIYWVIFLFMMTSV
jgi:hypothetical protein